MSCSSLFQSVSVDNMDKKFAISVSLKNIEGIKELGIGYGTSKKEAEQNAAKNACSFISKDLVHIINRDI